MKKANYFKNLIIKSNKEEFKKLIEIFIRDNWDKKELDKMYEIFETKNLQLIATQNLNNFIIENIYEEEIGKISFILNNDELLKKIKGLKVLFFGETGTGKTSLVNFLKRINENIFFKEINMEEIVSSKLGQTQINILKLARDLNNDFKDHKAIIFLDELDSIVSSRNNHNDIGEHSRIVSTFIKFLDSLNNNIILFSATNILEKIDSAIIRRFNLKVEGKNFNYKKFIEFYNSEIEIPELTLPTRKIINSLDKNNSKVEFNLSELDSFIKEMEIKFEMLKHKKIDTFAEFLIFFEKKLNFDLDSFSTRAMQSYKRSIKNNE